MTHATPIARDTQEATIRNASSDALCLLADGGWTLFAITPASRLEHAEKRTGLHRITLDANFEAQAWVRDYAVPIDTPEDTAFDATDFILRTCLEDLAHPDNTDAEAVLDYGDRLRGAETIAPWTHDHTGPFTIHYDEALLDALISAAQEGCIQRL